MNRIMQGASRQLRLLDANDRFASHRRVLFSANAALVAMALMVGRPLHAQRSSNAANACRIDTTAEWYVKQRLWSGARETQAWSDSAFRNDLLRAAGIQSSGGGMLMGYEIIGEAQSQSVNAGDSVLRARVLDTLRARAAVRGSTWPVRSVVGAAGVRAVWMLVAPDTALSRIALHRMMEAGPDESPPSAVATLEDRLRIRAGRKQIYGTQLVRENGQLVPAPLEDAAHVDMRRDAAGLPPLSQALCAARASPRK